jgi:riboflavin kinase
MKGSTSHERTLINKEPNRGNMELSGMVSSGLGRAHVFMAQPHYQDQFRQILGEKAWPGTLNVVIDKDLFSHYIALRQKAGIDTLDAPEEDRERAKTHDVSSYDRVRIRGFLRDGVSFGGASAYKGTISHGGTEVDCAVLIPDLTRHVDVVEVISKAFLREHFELSDGDRITISL